jgi:hypothetical protein
LISHLYVKCSVAFCNPFKCFGNHIFLLGATSLYNHHSFLRADPPFKLYVGPQLNESHLWHSTSSLAGGSTQDGLPYNIPIIVTFPCFIGQQIIFYMIDICSLSTYTLWTYFLLRARQLGMNTQHYIYLDESKAIAFAWKEWY